jgi:DNA modification methylase
MTIEYKPLKDIKPYVNNAKLHPKEQVEQIKRSIQEFGFNDPIAIDEHNVIIEGHGRFIAVKELGYTEVPVIQLSHLTEAQKRAYIIAHNKLTLNSDFDIDLIIKELEDIKFDIDITLTGFDDIDTLLNIEPDEVVEDDFEVEVPTEPKSKIGDLWLLDNHRVLCGDSTDDDTVKRLIDGNTIDVVFTDPPYGMNLDTDFSKMTNKSKNFGTVNGGTNYEKGIVDTFNPKMIDTILSINSRETFIWGVDYFAEFIKNKNNGSWIVWDKRANNNDDIEQDYSSDKIYGSTFELCWSKIKHKRDMVRVKWAGVFGISNEDIKHRIHPTQKPLKLVDWFLKKYSNDNDKVLDLFGGSGSTLIATEQLNRQCYMMELDPKYIDVIVQRYKAFKDDANIRLIRNGNTYTYDEIFGGDV